MNFAWNYIYFGFLRRDKKKDKTGNSQKKKQVIVKELYVFIFHFSCRLVLKADIWIIQRIFNMMSSWG